ncbi:recombination protein NinG [Pseudomonas sp. E102]|uniref:recombination protein NinG n=1 Tax=Pseudomonas sp. E102 TaxID=181579 RepID=UPI004045CEA1
MIAKQPKPKKCKNPACGVSFPPRRLGQVVCSPACAVSLVQVKREQERKSLAQLERRAIKAAKERIKSRSQHMKEAQVAFNAWVRLRDAGLPCVSCGRHHNGQWHAGHYRTVGGSPELRFEPLNVWRQCAPCNNHQSGNIVNYRIELVKRIGEEKVAWLEGPHQPRKYTIEELKTIKAKYRAKARELKRAAA